MQMVLVGRQLRTTVLTLDAHAQGNDGGDYSRASPECWLPKRQIYRFEKCKSQLGMLRPGKKIWVGELLFQLPEQAKELAFEISL